MGDCGCIGMLRIAKKNRPVLARVDGSAFYADEWRMGTKITAVQITAMIA